MKKLLTPLIIVLMVAPAVVAQNSNDGARTNVDETLVRRVGGVVLTRPAEEITGSPYLHESFILGKVLFGDNATSEIIQMDYNVFRNEVHYTDNGRMMAVDFKQITGFVFIDPATENVVSTFKIGESDEKLDITTETPLKVLYSGNQVKLYEQYNTYVNEIKNSYTGINTTKYVSKKYIVFKNENGEMKRVKIKKKDFLKMIDSTHKKAMDSHLKSTKNKVKSPADAAAFLTYYESLLENS